MHSVARFRQPSARACKDAAHRPTRVLQTCTNREYDKNAPCKRDSKCFVTSSPGFVEPSRAHDSGQGPAADWNEVILATIWPKQFQTTFTAKSQELKAYIQMARLGNVMPSAALVLVGAWVATKSLTCLLNPIVLTMTVVSAAIAVSSVVVNDYFDFRLGVDGINAPDKPLPSGIVTPDGALLLASTIYCAVLILACVLAQPYLRAIVAASAAATLAYTPILKRITAIKNLTVAFIIAASPFTGAIAAAGPEALGLALPAAGYLFSVIFYREVLMDINDRAGDGAMGLRTIPVVLGPTAALALACAAPIAGAAAVAATVAAGGGGIAAAAAAAAGAGPMAGFVCSAVAMLALGWGVVLRTFRDATELVQSGFEREVVDRGIERGFAMIAVGLLVLSGFT